MQSRAPFVEGDLGTLDPRISSSWLALVLLATPVTSVAQEPAVGEPPVPASPNAEAAPTPPPGPTEADVAAIRARLDQIEKDLAEARKQAAEETAARTQAEEKLK